MRGGCSTSAYLPLHVGMTVADVAYMVGAMARLVDKENVVG